MFNSYQTTTLRHDPALCDGCGICISVCPHAVFARQGRTVGIARADACMECGACALNCPTGAIAVESGVGCAAAMIGAAIRGDGNVSCGCDGGSTCCGPAAIQPTATTTRAAGLKNLPMLNATSCCGPASTEPAATARTGLSRDLPMADAAPCRGTGQNDGAASECCGETPVGAFSGKS